MTWTWPRLGDVVRRLRLPAGEYVVDRVGYGLSRDPSSTADRVDLLVTETGWRRLRERGWQEKGGGTVLRHPDEPDLCARVASLDAIRHEIREVDGVPVVAVAPPPPAVRRVTWRQRVGVAATGVLMTTVLAGWAYGFTLFSPTPDTGVTWQHLTFRTTPVQATVEDWTEIGTCSGAKVWDTSPRIEVDLAWTQDGRDRSATWTSCHASVDSPQEVWVTADGVVASQDAPWMDHVWPALLVALVPLAFVVMPIAGRLRAGWQRRRRA